MSSKPGFLRILFFKPNRAWFKNKLLGGINKETEQERNPQDKPVHFITTHPAYLK
jgi:hypothetical protein